MRVLVVTNYPHVASSRPEAEIYLQLQARGFQITIATGGESYYTERAREAGIRIVYAQPRKRRDEEATAAIRTELQRVPYDVLVLYNSRAIANGVRAAKGIEVKVVAYRGYAGNLHWYDPSNYLKIFHPRVDAILCNNVGVQRHIQANRWWASRDITYVVNKGHDLNWYDDAEAPTDKATLGVPGKAPMLVCVANAAKFKGVPYLLRAMALLDQSLGVHLVLCGRNMDTPAHRQLAAAVPEPERIHFPGFRDDVYGIVKAATLKVLPSISGESLTKAAIEAMALGTPVLITDIPGNEELLEHGVSGYKVPPRDAEALAEAIELLVQDAPLRKRLAEGARARLAGPLSHENTVNAMASFFRELAGSRASSARPA